VIRRTAKNGWYKNTKTSNTLYTGGRRWEAVARTGRLVMPWSKEEEDDDDDDPDLQNFGNEEGW